MIPCNCPAPPDLGPSLATVCGGSQIFLFMGILDQVLREQCDLADTCRTPKSITSPDLVYDFIVVGSGSAGSVMGSRLSENPQHTVLLIEAGDNEPIGTQVPLFQQFSGSDIDWNYTTEPNGRSCRSTGGRCKWVRGKVMGGCSTLNGMIYNRGNHEDYDRWAQENRGWSYNEVLPFFLKAENNQQLDDLDLKYHSSGGPLSVSFAPDHTELTYDILRATEQMGLSIHDLNGENSTGSTVTQLNIENGVRCSASKAYVRPAANRPNLDIWLRTMVSKVLINPSTKQAYGVEAIDRNGHKFEVHIRKEVIISAGVAESPKLLMLSGVGPLNHLKHFGIETIHNLPGVGQNLQDHVGYLLQFTFNEKDEQEVNWDTASEYLNFRRGPLAGTALSDITAKWSTSFVEPGTGPDAQLFLGGGVLGADSCCSKTGDVGELFRTCPGSISFLPTMLALKSRGNVLLASANFRDHPLLFGNYLSDPQDVKMLLEAIKWAINLTQSDALNSYNLELEYTDSMACGHLGLGTDAYWECAIRQTTFPIYHAAGTCKMGVDRMAVVDNLLKVHGINGLRVVDASIMPTVTRGNLNGPTIMIAEKAASIIAAHWQNS